MELRNGDIIAVYGEDWISQTIEFIQNSKYVHTAGIVGKNQIIEINGFKKTNYDSLSMYNGRYDVFVCDTLTDEQRVKIVEYVTSQIGTVYDYVLIVKEFIRLVFHIVIPHKAFHNHICSTLWSDAYMSVGIDLCPNIKYPSPSELSKSKLLRKI